MRISKDCFFVPVLNHVLTIGQDLSIKTKKLKTMTEMSQQNASKDSVPEMTDIYTLGVA